MANTIRWLKAANYRNVFVDIDNEGMAKRAMKFDSGKMVIAGIKWWLEFLRDKYGPYIAPSPKAEPGLIERSIRFRR